MNKERLVKFVKAMVGILAFAGVSVSPENSEMITQGFFAFYSVASGVGALFKKK